ncbi:UNVERIFIED_CONTAM: hypothetical protein RMT77_013001 [Armadillidium vulgare]
MLYIYLLVIAISPLVTKGLMFPPDTSYGNQPCTDNSICPSGCCLIISETFTGINGLCQSMGQFGQYCAPGNRLRNVGGSKMYSHSCPCQPGLDCKPLWVRHIHGMTVMQDPKCTPREISPSSPVMSRYLYNAFPEVPVE